MFLILCYLISYVSKLVIWGSSWGREFRFRGLRTVSDPRWVEFRCPQDPVLRGDPRHDHAHRRGRPLGAGRLPEVRGQVNGVVRVGALGGCLRAAIAGPLPGPKYFDV